MAQPIEAQDLPGSGPLQLGAVYRRHDLHERFGGNRYTGIVPSSREPVVLLFHTEEPARQFYRDGFDEQGVYWYSGEGTSGDMRWNATNRAIRDHQSRGADLFFFERVQRQGGLWRFSRVMSCIGFKTERRPDSDGNDRLAIIFGLLPIEAMSLTGALSTIPSDAAPPAEPEIDVPLEADPTSVSRRLRNVYLRAAAVKEHALRRARGCCEACENAAPFTKPSGEPYLEVHHIDRLSDGGPDRAERVAAICPNCHCRCHYSSDSAAYNAGLRTKILEAERRYQQSRTGGDDGREDGQLAG